MVRETLTAEVGKAITALNPEVMDGDGAAPEGYTLRDTSKLNRWELQHDQSTQGLCARDELRAMQLEMHGGGIREPWCQHKEVRCGCDSVDPRLLISDRGRSVSN